MNQKWLIVLLFVLSGCVRSVPHDGILIAVSIPPQAWFVSQIAGDKADTLILVPHGQNPHNYEPSLRSVRGITSASAWILSGTEFEISLRPKIERLFSNLKIIDGTSGIQHRLLESHDDHVFVGCCEAVNIDRHSWLGRVPAIILATHIVEYFCFIDSENEEYYYERYINLCEQINEEFDKLIIDLAPLKGKNVFVFHPSFGYFFDEFGIIQEAVETGGKEPTPRQLNLLIEKMTEEQPAAIFVQKQFPVNAARTLANAVGAQVIELDPLAGDWLDNIRFMGRMLKKAAL